MPDCTCPPGKVALRCKIHGEPLPEDDDLMECDLDVPEFIRDPEGYRGPFYRSDATPDALDEIDLDIPSFLRNRQPSQEEDGA